MKDKEIFKALLNHSINFRNNYQRLKAWDSSKTLEENMTLLKMPSMDCVRLFAGKFNLGFQYLRIKSGYVRRSNLNEKKIKRLYSNQRTVAENAKACGVSTSTMRYFINRYSLPMKEGVQGQHGHDEKVKLLIKQARHLRQQGFTYERIGSMYGLSRQRIHQLI